MAETAEQAISRIEAPYDDVLHALKVAYGKEGRSLVKISPYLKNLRGGTVRLTSDETPWDRMVGAALIRAAVNSKMNVAERAAIEGWYTVPHTRELEWRKDNDCVFLATSVSLGRSIPLAFAVDITRAWSGHRRQQNDRQWSESIGVSPKTIKGWKFSRRLLAGRPEGILPSLWFLLEAATDHLESELYDHGAIKFWRRKK